MSAEGPNYGKILRVIGPTLDVEFPSDRLPAILNAITVEGDGTRPGLTVEAALHIGDNVIRCIAMGPTDGLVRGMRVLDTGGPISVPVGNQVLGRVLNLLGEPIDELGPLPEPGKTMEIHRHPPGLTDQSTAFEIIETGIRS